MKKVSPANAMTKAAIQDLLALKEAAKEELLAWALQEGRPQLLYGNMLSL